MRTFIAALLAATASLPSLVHAQTSPVIPDPADAAASAPALSAPSFFAAYVGYREPDAPNWPALNRAVTKLSSGHEGMHQEMMHSMSGDAGAGAGLDMHGTSHEEPPK
ncbi:hypothetical protein [Paraburkholderia sp. BL21I4N1]|uniref:hypothetical protein n=1 Tax=Paraburkholderia sp. BL21I4N1 TaxID=1938801 RepID=UPI000CFC39FD|nr:hypothetical protein [Paraburkholderia sp. BL21I4N1]PQV50042.1 hypothetical protein B0G83_106331 [Paraburkholderia sp. BL21I4N1]